jgi:hypothetical protein
MQTFKDFYNQELINEITIKKILCVDFYSFLKKLDSALSGFNRDVKLSDKFDSEDNYVFVLTLDSEDMHLSDNITKKIQQTIKSDLPDVGGLAGINYYADEESVSFSIGIVGFDGTPNSKKITSVIYNSLIKELFKGYRK